MTSAASDVWPRPITCPSSCRSSSPRVAPPPRVTVSPVVELLSTTACPVTKTLRPSGVLTHVAWPSPITLPPGRSELWPGPDHAISTGAHPEPYRDCVTCRLAWG